MPTDKNTKSTNNHKYNTIEWKFSSTMNWKKDVPGPIELNSVWKIL